MTRETARSVDAFFKGLEDHAVDRVASLLADDAVLEIPFNASGSTAPAARFDGKQAVLGYVNQIVSNFSRAVLVDKRVYVAEGETVFFEGKGDLVHRASGAKYKNLYVFKFVFRADLIARITEYSNPVIYAKLVGSPIG